MLSAKAAFACHLIIQFRFYWHVTPFFIRKFQKAPLLLFQIMVVVMHNVEPGIDNTAFCTFAVIILDLEFWALFRVLYANLFSVFYSRIHMVG